MIGVAPDVASSPRDRRGALPHQKAKARPGGFLIRPSKRSRVVWKPFAKLRQPVGFVCPGWPIESVAETNANWKQTTRVAKQSAPFYRPTPDLGHAPAPT